MFTGRYDHTIDRKGRVAIPAKFRDEITREYDNEPLVITNLEKCLVLFPQREWARTQERAKHIPLSNAEAQDWLRFFVSGGAPSFRPLTPPTERRLFFSRLENGHSQETRRIGKATVMPGDVVLGRDGGVIFIPPHLAERVVTTSEIVRLRDMFGHQRLREQVYQELWPLPNIDGLNVQVCTFSAAGTYAGSCVRADRSLVINMESDCLPLRIVPDQSMVAAGP